MYIQSSLQQGEDTRLTSRGKIPVPSGRRRRHNQIPAGCSVSTGIYSIHSLLYCPPQTRTPRNNGCPTKQSQRHINLGVSSAKYAPFSQGTRACIGRHLAQLKLQMALASIMWSYDMRRPAMTAAMMGAGHAGQALGERTRRNSNFTTRSSARTRPVIQLRPRGHTQQKTNRVGYSAGYKEQYRPPEEMIACR